MGGVATKMALFYMDWNNVLDRRWLNWEDDTVGGWNEGNWTDLIESHTFLNEGDAEVTGLELSTNFDINDVWWVGGNLTWLDATYNDYCAPQATEYFTSNTPPLENVIPILTRDDDGVLVSMRCRRWKPSPADTGNRCPTERRSAIAK